MKRLFSKLRSKWLLLIGATTGILFATNKFKGLYWGLIAVVVLLKFKGRKLLGKYNNMVLGGVLLYFIYCFAMDFLNKNAIGKEKVSGVFDNVTNKFKSIFNIGV